MYPLISVYLPYYNDKQFLEESIRSVIQQTYPHFELILFNHASTDGSRDIAHSFDDKRITHIDGDSNLGAGSTLNFLQYFLPHIQGDYIKLFCADDVLHKRCFEILITTAKEHPHIDLFYSNLLYIDKNSTTLKPYFCKQARLDILNAQSHGINELRVLNAMVHMHNLIPFPTTFFKRNFCDLCVFDKTMIMFADLSLWLSSLINGAKLHYIDKPIAYYRQHEGQLNIKTETFHTRQFYEILKYMDLIYSIQDISVIKIIYPRSPYNETLTVEDTEFIPFILSHYYLLFGEGQQKIHAYMKMHDLLQEDTMREKIMKRFHFGIKEFRELYSI